MMIPEPIVGGDPVTHRVEAFGNKTVTMLAAMSLFGHETGIAQHAKMLRDGGPAHFEMPGHSVNGVLGLRQQIEHMAPRRMTDGSEDIRRALGTPYHASTIRKQTL